MTIRANVIADSISDGCPRLTTIQLRYPRFIHAEFMTHRVFSRNSSSSRAIPVNRMIQNVIDDPAIPISWNKEQRGMQGGVELQSGSVLWMMALNKAIDSAEDLSHYGYHKQIVNRIIEPFQHINVLVTATEWDNFFALRDHPDAQPEIQALARVMRDAIDGSKPDNVMMGQWHTPYVEAPERIDHHISDAIKISSARCASVSYKTVDGKEMTSERALSIYNKLTGDPLHASPFEHIATPCPENDKEKTRNFNGWAQYRYFLEEDKE